MATPGTQVADPIYSELAQHRFALAHAIPDCHHVDKLIRYETMINRQLDRILIQLERYQRARLGERVPPPLTVDVSGGDAKSA